MVVVVVVVVCVWGDSVLQDKAWRKGLHKVVSKNSGSNTMENIAKFSCRWKVDLK